MNDAKHWGPLVAMSRGCLIYYDGWRRVISLIFSPSFSLLSRTPTTFLPAYRPPRCNVFSCTLYHEVCHWIQRQRRNLHSSSIFQEGEKCKFCLSYILIFMFLHLLCRRRILCFFKPPLPFSYFCSPSSSYLLRCHLFLFLVLSSSLVLLSFLVVLCIPSLLCLLHSLDLSSLLLFYPSKFARFRLSLLTRLGIKQWSSGLLTGFFWRNISPSQDLYLPLAKLPEWHG